MLHFGSFKHFLCDLLFKLGEICGNGFLMGGLHIAQKGELHRKLCFYVFWGLFVYLLKRSGNIVVQKSLVVSTTEPFGKGRYWPSTGRLEVLEM